jgi:type 1 glutamine amidotransferase
MTRSKRRLAAPFGLSLLISGLIGLAGLGDALAQDQDQPIRALLVIGGCCHDYDKQRDILTKGISGRANVQWKIAYDADKTTRHKNPVYENPDWAKGFDVVVHDECTADVTDMNFINGILKPHRDGLPAVVLHCGMHCYRTDGWRESKAPTPWFEFTGVMSTAHGAQQPIDVMYVAKDNPITKGMADWKTINEELYNNGNRPDVKPLPTATPLAGGKQTVRGRNGQETTSDYVVVWTNLYNNKAKVFATTLGHNNATVSDPRYLDLITRGLLWSVGKLDDAHLKPAKKVLIDG